MITHALSARVNGTPLIDTVAGHSTILLRQKVHREVNAAEFADPARRDCARARPDGQAHRIELVPK
jgi:hypothetical protein